MKAEEIASKLFQEQGFIVVGSFGPRKIGEVIPVTEGRAPNCDGGILRLEHPLVIVGESTLDEFAMQSKAWGHDHLDGNYAGARFWRTVPGD